MFHLIGIHDLESLAQIIGGKLSCQNAIFSSLVVDSRKVVKNSVFLALKGDTFDGNNYCQDAIDKGALAVITDIETTINNAIIVEDSYLSLLKLAQYQQQKVKPKTIAITGSNGKTTVKEMIGQVLSEEEAVITHKNENNEYSIDLTLEKLSLLKPIFRKNGTVTAGNSSGINDGAAAVLLMSRDKANELGLIPMARWVGSAVAGVDPGVMGYGPVPSTKKLLKRFNITLDDIGLIELNEAFASQSIGVMQKLNMNPDITNVNGGAIALGHPLGCSGARILTTLIHEMKKRDTKYGLATLCVGVGQGVTTLVEGL